MKNKVLFIGSECYPFVKSGGLGDVMGSLPKALAKEGADVRVMIPNYKCIPQEYKEQMQYMTNFYMGMKKDGTQKYVGIMMLKMDGVSYYFIDNEEYFSEGNPYTDMKKDIEKYVFFDKACLAALSKIDFQPEIIHCHDWQTGLVPVYLRTLFHDTKLAQNAKCVFTIHNLKFQGITNIDTMRYISGLPDYVFTYDRLGFQSNANMLKGALVYADKITTVSSTYAGEIKTKEFGEGLDNVVGHFHTKLCGIVNGIDYDIYDPAHDPYLFKKYSIKNIFNGKKQNKLRLQKEIGLEQDENKIMIGMISRLTDQKGLDLVNAIMNQMADENTQFVLIGTGDKKYENIFRRYEDQYKGKVCSNIMYSEERAHKLYAAADLMLVPSKFEPCGLTQLIAMRYGTLPLVRETGGLKDTIQAYDEYIEAGNGFSFDQYCVKALLDVINYAKHIYFDKKKSWRAMMKRAMKMNFSWEVSAKNYMELYDSLS